MKISHIYVLLVALNLVGFPLVAGLAAYLGAGSTPYSISMRATILGLSALLIVSTVLGNKVRFVRGIFWLPLAVFWCAYLIRIYLDTSMHPASLARNVADYWFWAVGACLVPMLGLLTYPNRNYFESSYKPAFIIAAAASLLTTFLGTGVIQAQFGSSYDTGRLQLQSLNAISAGHLGLSLLLLSVWPFLNSRRLTFGYREITLFSTGLLGLYLLVASASRGPLVAFMAVLLFFFAAQDSRRHWRMLVAIAFIVVVGGLVSGGLEGTGTSRLFSRSENALSGQDTGVAGRQVAYKGALEQFLQSPILGDSLEEKQTGFYPHNVILESFMATGLIGGMSFLLLIGYGVYVGFRIVKMRSEHGWISLIFIQYLVAAQFSGALYSVTIMWTFLALTLVLFCAKGWRQVDLDQLRKKHAFGSGI